MNFTYLESLNNGLIGALTANPNVYLIGEDLNDPYGGAFKVSKGASYARPTQVISTPISESAFTGLGTGMAIRGMRPVIEIMFGDFITLCTDQILNGATKFTTMYGKALEVPLLIRTPMGGGRGYGPTHSQSIEKMFLGIPNLTVVSPSLGHNPGNLLRQSIENITNPLLFVEYKSLYPKKLISSDEIINIREVENPEKHPVVLAKNFTSGEPDVIVITYGGGSEQLFEVMRSLAIDEIRIEGVLPSRIDLKGEPPWWFDLIKTDIPIIVAEHGTPGTTWGTEIASLLYESFFSTLTMPIRRLSCADEVIPAKVSLESSMMLTSEKLSQAVIEMLG